VAHPVPDIVDFTLLTFPA